MKTNVYIDGFNLYYGCIKGKPYHWLDLGKLCRLALSGHSIHRIRYFTAMVESTPEDPDKANRQAVYLRALTTIPAISIHKGLFLSHRVRMPLANPALGGPRTVEVIKREEKGSDVNLATYLLVDGFDHDYEYAVVISNDSDLLEPIKVVRDRLDTPVGILNPHARRPSRVLQEAASFFRPIKEGLLKASLFPPVLNDARGEICKPAEW